MEYLRGNYSVEEYLFCDVLQTKKKIQSNIVQAYKFRIFAAQKYLKDVGSNEYIAYLLKLYVSYQMKHLYGFPVVHVGLCSDLVHTLHMCNFFLRDKSQNIPIIHILSKALPQRCQFRNLKEICSDYCLNQPGIFEWFKQIIRCSFLSLYPHCRVFLTHDLYVQFQLFLFKQTKQTLSKWIRMNGYLIFYIIKEYIIYMIKFNPALFDTLSTRYNWLMFEKTCSTAMDMTRSIILMQSKDKHLFHGINEELSKINAYQLKYSFSQSKKTRFCHGLTCLKTTAN